MQPNERLKYLRKDILNLTQGEFSQKINISRANLASIEVGRINLTERVIADVCRELNVNEAWLHDGIEPIFLDANDPLTNEIVKLYNTLTDENQKYLKGYMQRLLDEQNTTK